MGKFSKFDGQILSAGDILHHEFERQTDNHRALYKILKRNKLFFQKMELTTLDGIGRARGRKFVTFKAYAEGLVWHKYESGSHGAGQNWVMLHGVKHKLTDFLAWPEEKQDAVLTDPNYFKRARVAKRLRNEEKLSEFEVIAAKQGWTFDVHNAKSGTKRLAIEVLGVPGFKFLDKYKEACEEMDEFLKSNGFDSSRHIPPALLEESRHALIKFFEEKTAILDQVQAILGETWTVGGGSGRFSFYVYPA
jgi:hypothetical protein